MLQRVQPVFRKRGLYFDRGISVCQRWYKFENFLADMGRKPEPSRSLDRKNNNRGYSKSNCRWATPKQQNRNRRNTCRVRFDGESLTLVEWADNLGMKYVTLFARYNRGERGARLFRQPDDPKHRCCRYITANGETLSLSEWGRRYSLDIETIRGRYAKGDRYPDLFRKVKTHA
jgi:hypothetical protein